MSMLLPACSVTVHHSGLQYVPAGRVGLDGEVDTYDRILWQMESDRDLLELARQEHVSLGCTLVLARSGSEIASHIGYVVATGEEQAEDGRWRFLGIVRFGSDLSRERLLAHDYDGAVLGLRLLCKLGPGWYSFSSRSLERDEVLQAVARGTGRGR